MRVREQARTRDALRPSMERGDLTNHVIIQDKQKTPNVNALTRRCLSGRERLGTNERPIPVDTQGWVKLRADPDRQRLEIEERIIPVDAQG